MNEYKNDSSNPVLTFEGKKYLINDLSNEIKESIKILQIAETQLKMHQDTLKLLSISRNSLANQLRENLNDPAKPVLTFEGKKYLINELSQDIKDSIKSLQIAETQLKMHEDTLKLLSISRNTLANQLRDKLKNLA